MPDDGGRPLAFAVAGSACISSSAVVMQLADTSASVAALGRCVFALPVLGLLILLERRRGARPLAGRSRWLARLSGVFLAADLILWSHSISAIGAGLGTVVPSLQVLIVSLLAWLVAGERPRRSLVLASPAMLAGLALVGGLTGSRAYGADPALGVAEGAGVAVLYAIYIFTLRQATSIGNKPSPLETLTQATLGAAAASVVLGLTVGDFRLGPAWPAHNWPTLNWPTLNWPALGWLALLAVTSQVIGWLLITTSMPRLPAWMIGAVLLVQPAGSVLLGYLALSERPSASQLAGVALMMTGVLIAVTGRRGRPPEHQDHAPGAGRVEGDIVEVTVAGDDVEAAGEPDRGIELGSGPEPVRHHVGDGTH
ncbi:MAG: DMT family transporter [Streptosporangiaceae bacterium]|nr:DMT family transporter [Streptosporangiaceae bacterium]